MQLPSPVYNPGLAMPVRSDLQRAFSWAITHAKDKGISWAIMHTGYTGTGCSAFSWAITHAKDKGISWAIMHTYRVHGSQDTVRSCGRSCMPKGQRHAAPSREGMQSHILLHTRMHAYVHACRTEDGMQRPAENMATPSFVSLTLHPHLSHPQPSPSTLTFHPHHSPLTSHLPPSSFTRSLTLHPHPSPSPSPSPLTLHPLPSPFNLTLHPRPSTSPFTFTPTLILTLHPHPHPHRHLQLHSHPHPHPRPSPSPPHPQPSPSPLTSHLSPSPPHPQPSPFTFHPHLHLHPLTLTQECSKRSSRRLSVASFRPTSA